MMPNQMSDANSSNDEARKLGQFNAGFTSHAPPFFTNPFMAPFLSQYRQTSALPNTGDTNSDKSSTSPRSSSPSPNDSYLASHTTAQKSDFRMNPLTEGYYLSPNQYQEMMQCYMQNLMIAAQQAPISQHDFGMKANTGVNGMSSCSEPPSSNTPECQSSESVTNFHPHNPVKSTYNDLFASFTSTNTPNPDSCLLHDNQRTQRPPGWLLLADSDADAIDFPNLFPMTSANLDNHEASEAQLPSPPSVPASPSLVDSKSEHEKTSSSTDNSLIEVQPSISGSPTSSVTDDGSSTVVDTTKPDSDGVESAKTPTSPKESRLSPTIEDSKAEQPESSKALLQLEKPELSDTQPPPPPPSTSLNSTKQDDSKRPMDPNMVVAQKAPINTSTEERTSELIKKQMNEIEKEISRRMQNQNIRKIDEKELAQLLNDHGFGSFVDANGTTAGLDFTVNFANAGHGAAHGTPQAEAQQAEKPTLDQLRSSFSPPDEQLISSGTDSMPYNSGVAATGNKLGLHGPAAFATSLILPQAISSATFQNQATLANGHYTISAQQQPHLQFVNTNAHHNPGAIPTQPLLLNDGINGPFNYMNYVQGQPVGQMPNPHASYGMSQNYPAAPVTSTITPEMAAAFLQQLQQQNPALLQNLVGQHNFMSAAAQPAVSTPVENSRVNEQQFGNNAVKCTAVPQSTSAQKSQITGIPAPPAPHNTVHRKNTSEGPLNASNTSAQCRSAKGENGWPTTSSNGDFKSRCENKENGGEPPVWIMRDTFLKRMQREEQRLKQNGCADDDQNNTKAESQQNTELEEEETDKLLKKNHNEAVEDVVRQRKGSNKKEVLVHEPAVLIEGVLFRARYLGSTQLVTDSRTTKASRMAQAQEAVSRVKAPDGESQPSTEIDLFISTEKIMVLNTDLQRISDTDVRQDIVIDMVLRSISYIADIGDLVVLIARRLPQACENSEEDIETIRRTPRMICHVFESEEASFIVQSIGQAFQVAYVEFLRANGIDDPAYLREIDYQEVLNSQELMGEELEMFARKETQKDVIVPKKVGEALGVVVVESGWGSMLPTVVLASLAPGGPAARSNQLNIGDQIIAINGISLVGLPLVAAQQNIKNAKTSTAVRLTVVSTPPVVEVRIKRPDTKYQLGFSVQNGVICSLLRGGIAERGGIRVGHRIIEINTQSVVAVPHEKIVNMLATAAGEIYIKTMPTSMFRLLTGQEVPNYI